jgi:tryptophan-rich hypothetical protein
MSKGKYPHLVGSKWTATSDTFGWRHFLVTNRKNEGATVFAEMKSACGPDVRFWVNAKALQDRRLWLPGWVLLADLTGMPGVDHPLVG